MDGGNFLRITDKPARPRVDPLACRPVLTRLELNEWRTRICAAGYGPNVQRLADELYDCWDDKRCVSWPGLDWLARKTGISKAHLSRAFGRLVRDGLVDRYTVGRHRENIHTIPPAVPAAMVAKPDIEPPRACELGNHCRVGNLIREERKSLDSEPSPVPFTATSVDKGSEVAGEESAPPRDAEPWEIDDCRWAERWPDIHRRWRRPYPGEQVPGLAERPRGAGRYAAVVVTADRGVPLRKFGCWVDCDPWDAFSGAIEDRALLRDPMALGAPRNAWTAKRMRIAAQRSGKPIEWVPAVSDTCR